MATNKINYFIRLDVMFNGFSIFVEKHNNNNSVYFSVNEKNHRNGWQEVTPKAADFIVNEFKKTEEYRSMLTTINEVSNKYQ